MSYRTVFRKEINNESSVTIMEQYTHIIQNMTQSLKDMRDLRNLIKSQNDPSYLDFDANMFTEQYNTLYNVVNEMVQDGYNTLDKIRQETTKNPFGLDDQAMGTEIYTFYTFVDLPSMGPSSPNTNLSSYKIFTVSAVRANGPKQVIQYILSNADIISKINKNYAKVIYLVIQNNTTLDMTYYRLVYDVAGKYWIRDEVDQSVLLNDLKRIMQRVVSSSSSLDTAVSIFGANLNNILEPAVLDQDNANAAFLPFINYDIQYVSNKITQLNQVNMSNSLPIDLLNLSTPNFANQSVNTNVSSFPALV